MRSRCFTFVLTFVVFSAIGVCAQKEVCGRNFNETTGVLQSTKFPYSMDPSEKCVWRFELSDNNNVFLMLETVDLGAKDSLSIFDGVNFYNYTGLRIPHQQLFLLNPKNSYVEVTTSSDPIPASTIKRFKAEYTAKPNDSNIYFINEDYMGVIKSPKYTQKNGSAIYNWIITQKPEKSIYLSFKSFNISSGLVTIDDEITQRNYTGSELPSDIAASASVTITLTLNLNIPDQTFQLYFSQLFPNCSADIKLTDEKEKIVNFHGIPSEVPVRCFVVVEGPESSVFSAAVNWKDIYASQNRTDVVLVLGDGASQFSPPLLADSPVNGNTESFVVTKTNKIWIGFTYSFSVDGVNMSVVLTVHNQGAKLEKSGTFGVKATSNTTLFSNSSIYILNVNSEEQVVATLADNVTFSNESQILFYDGNTPDRLIARFNNMDKLFYPVISTKSQMLVVAQHFKENETFEASFFGSPKGYDRLTADTFGTYDVEGMLANSTRTWIIAPHTNSSDVISLIISHAHLTPDLELTIYEGTSNTSKVAYNVTNTTIVSSLVYISSEKGCAVTFENKGNVTTGLIADLSYQLVPECNQILNLTEIASGVVNSINFPNAYPSNAVCQWHIISDKFFLLNFKSFDLPSTQPLSIYSVSNNETKLLSSLSGSEPIDDLIYTESHLMLNWSSVLPVNNLTVGKGFEIEVLTIDCGGMYSESTKQFSTPEYPSAVRNSTRCVWSVVIPPKQADKPEIVKLSYTSVPIPPSTAKLTIYEGGSIKSQEANISTKNVSVEYLSRTNKLVVEYNYTEDKIGGTPYTFTVDTYICTEFCKNGICLHDAWRCNGQNDCGDNSDEIDCQGSPIIAPSSGVSVTSLVVAILLCLTIGAVGAIALPIAWKRIRSHGRNYQEFRNSADA